MGRKLQYGDPTRPYQIRVTERCYNKYKLIWDRRIRKDEAEFYKELEEKKKDALFDFLVGS
ncbi:MAG: hypothetical protein ACTSR8_19330 [Promethearchaeota archaeon]